MAAFRKTVSDLMAEDSGAVKHTRRPFQRMHEIHRAIKEGGYPNCSILAKQLEVTAKTVQRDITFMRDEFGLPLVYDGQLHGYRYDGSVEDFPEFEVGEERFVRPEDFDGRDYLRASFGIWNPGDGARPHLVRVRLRDYAARLAQERQWHPTQEIEFLNGKGDRVEVRFEAQGLEDVVRWILSFGSKAEVMAPKELMTMVREEVRLMKTG